MNRNYVKIADGRIAGYGPSLIGNKANAPEAEYNAAGYYRLAGEKPSVPDGHYLASTTYAVGEDNLAHAVYTYDAIPATVRRWTRLSIIRAIKAAGLWDSVKSIITEDQREEVLACDYVAEDDEMAQTVIAAAKVAFGEDKVDEMIDSIPTEA